LSEIVNGMDMRKRADWRVLLDSLIQSRAERERIAAQIGVNAVTLSRWASGETSPRPQNLLHLTQALPEQHRTRFRALVEEDLPSLSLDELHQENSILEISFQFFNTVLTTRAVSSPQHVFWVIIHQVLQHALLQLDPYRQGMKITIVQCMPPGEDGKIHSLREGIGLGTPPWPESFEEHALFLGAETLAGYTTATGHFHQVPDMRNNPTFLPYYRAEHEISAAACPIMWHGRVAGCVLFSSTQAGAFRTRELNILLECYTNLIALAFAERDFYPMDLIHLQVMPPPEKQMPYLASFRRRVMELMRASVNNLGQPLTSVQAELMTWQQIEKLLLERCMDYDPKFTPELQ
jgi:transcriptional regulator with XRE-family HTH domain